MAELMQDLLRQQIEAAKRIIELSQAMSSLKLTSGYPITTRPDPALLAADDEVDPPLRTRLGQLALAVQHFELQDFPSPSPHSPRQGSEKALLHGTSRRLLKLGSGHSSPRLLQGGLKAPLLPNEVRLQGILAPATGGGTAARPEVLKVSMAAGQDRPPPQDAEDLSRLRTPDRSSEVAGFRPTPRGQWNGNNAVGKVKSVKSKAVIEDAEKAKRELKESLLEPEYDVEKLYHKTGCAQAVARNDYFKSVAFVVIFLNGIWIGYDVDTNKADVLSDAPLLNQVVENIFCVFFLIEILIRFAAFQSKWVALRDGWFAFDLSMVVLMAWGTWINVLLVWWKGTSSSRFSKFTDFSSIFRIFRLFRIMRIARLARLLRDLPELMILAKGMFSAIRSVFSTLCMLLFIIYFFALFLTQLLWDQEAGRGCFENVLQAMNCLLLDGVFVDQADILRKMLDAGLIYYILVLAYLVVGSMTILNMLIGILCQVVSDRADEEKEDRMAQRIERKIKEVMPEIDKDSDAKVSKDEFKVLLTTPQALKQLTKLDVDVVAMVDLAEIIFHDKESLEFDDFVKTVLQFRGSNAATVKDFVDVRKFIQVELMKLEERLLGATSGSEDDESVPEIAVAETERLRDEY